MGKKEENKIWDVIVVGAGASGMMAAITAARRNLSVLVIEHMQKAGKKLLATGNGRCNFTNAVMEGDCFYGNRTLVQTVLSRFSVSETLDFFHEIGIYPKEKNGCYYPNSMQAASVVEAFTAEMEKCNVNQRYDTGLRSITQKDGQFLVNTTGGSFPGTNVILATGLLASPKLGSDGSAMPVIREMGHHFLPVLPVLCAFAASGLDFKGVSGVRCEAALSLFADKKLLAWERGELQLADYGISGIPVFQVSSPAVRALHDRQEVEVVIDFLPDLTYQEITEELLFRLKRGENTVFQMLNGLLNLKLINAIAKKAKMDVRNVVNETQVNKLAVLLKECQVTLKEARDFSFAQACTGGIRTEEIHMDTLESMLHSGLYFAGELLDVDGICGGYNLQWAWASGYVAGSAVRKHD